jgi:hypothetical protein
MIVVKRGVERNEKLELLEQTCCIAECDRDRSREFVGKYHRCCGSINIQSQSGC